MRRTLYAALAASIVLLARPASARVDVTLDTDSLNALIAGMAQDRIEVQLGGGRTLPILMENFHVTGFDPAGGDGSGAIKTAVTIRIPAFNLATPVDPILVFRCKDRDGKKACALVFEEFSVQLPMTGSVDLAALFPPMEILPESAWLVPTSKGKVRVKPTLIETRIGQKNLRLGFDLDVKPVGPTAGTPSN